MDKVPNFYITKTIDSEQLQLAFLIFAISPIQSRYDKQT